MFVSVLLEGLDEEGKPQVKWGASVITIKDPNRVLAVKVSPEKGIYRPGEEVVLRFKTTLNGQGEAAEVAVAVVDQTGMLVSEAKTVETTRGDCRKDHGKQAIQINFSRRRGTLGHAVPIRPPYEPTTPTPIPFSTPDGITRTLKVPILMYHYISEPPPESDKYRLDLSIEPELFRAQLARLREQNYTSITLSDLYYAIEAGKPLPENPIVLTFDDGYRDNYEYAFPIMKEEGFGAGYEYDHDAEDSFSGQNYFPDGMERPAMYAPVERGFERELKKRVDYFAKLRTQRGG
mgnify:CR=1 FL=1